MQALAMVALALPVILSPRLDCFFQVSNHEFCSLYSISSLSCNVEGLPLILMGPRLLVSFPSLWDCLGLLLGSLQPGWLDLISGHGLVLTHLALRSSLLDTLSR